MLNIENVEKLYVQRSKYSSGPLWELTALRRPTAGGRPVPFPQTSPPLSSSPKFTNVEACMTQVGVARSGYVLTLRDFLNALEKSLVTYLLNSFLF